jgi:hypothetical protein
MASLCPTSAQQSTTTTAGVSPFAQNYVDATLGAAQQEVFNMTPGAGGKMNITGIKPYVPFGAPMNAQGQVVPYGGQQTGMGWGAYPGYGQQSSYGQQGGYGQSGYFGTPPGGYGYGQPPATQQQSYQAPAFGPQSDYMPPSAFGPAPAPAAPQAEAPKSSGNFLEDVLNAFSGAPAKAAQAVAPAQTQQQDFGTYGFDQNVVDYLNKQRQGSAMDAGVAYEYDPATQTFKGATMGGPVTKTLAQIKQEADIINPANVPPPPGGAAVDPNNRLLTADGKQFFSSGQWWPNETVQAFGGMGGMGGMGAMPGARTMEYTPEQAQQDASMRASNPYFRQQREARLRDLSAQITGQQGGVDTGGNVAQPAPAPGSLEMQRMMASSPARQAVGPNTMYGPLGGTFPNFGQQPQQQQYQQQYQQPSTGYPTGTMQAGMGPGEQLAAESSVAGPSALQQRAYQSAYNMQVPGQYGEATDIGRAAGLGLLNTAGQAQGLQSLAQQAIQQGKQYGQDITDPFRTQAYMSPYMQNVVNKQQREAARQSGILGTQQAGQAVKSGAFGGSRAGLLEAERQRNLATQLGDIEASGLQAAYQNAQNQMLNAQNQAMQGYNYGMQGYNQGIAGQTGAYGQAAQGAGTLSNIGGQQLGSAQSIANLQNTFGQQQQANQQQIINRAMQNYDTRRLYPQQQLQWMNSMLSGLPVSSTGSVSNIPGPNMLSQLAGLGTTAVGAYGLYNKLFPGGKRGGNVRSNPAGGIASIGLSKALNK